MDSIETVDYSTAKLCAFWGFDLRDIAIFSNRLIFGNIPNSNSVLVLSYEPDMILEIISSSDLYFETELRGLEIAESEFPKLERIFPPGLKSDNFLIEDIGYNRLAYHADGPIVIVSEEGLIIDSINDYHHKLSRGQISSKILELSNGDYIIMNISHHIVVSSVILITSHEVSVERGLSTSRYMEGAGDKLSDLKPFVQTGNLTHFMNA